MQMKMRMSANASGQPNLFQNKIRELPILVPSMELQEKYICCADAIRQNQASQQMSKLELSSLFSSLQHLAFRGGL
jgi:hypothetical protein